MPDQLSAVGCSVVKASTASSGLQHRSYVDVVRWHHKLLTHDHPSATEDQH